jgi:hypothetical protein
VAPSPEEIFKRAPAADPVARVESVDAAFDAMMTANEASLRMMLARSMEHSIAADGAKLPKRQNRRLPLIEAALAPASKQFKLADLQMLSRSLALVIGTEGMVVFKDVLQISYAEARKKVRRWAIRAGGGGKEIVTRSQHVSCLEDCGFGRAQDFGP